MTSNKKLIQQCIKGRRRAQQELYDRYSGMVMGLCLRYARDQAQAEDIFQDAFIRVFENLKKVKEPEALPGWVRRTVINTALNILKSSISFIQPLDVAPDTEDHSYHELLDRLSNEQLVALINTLPLGYKTVFNLFAIDGLSHKEISQQLRITESTSRSQLTCARKMLREKLYKQGITSYESVV